MQILRCATSTGSFVSPSFHCVARAMMSFDRSASAIRLSPLNVVPVSHDIVLSSMV